MNLWRTLLLRGDREEFRSCSSLSLLPDVTVIEILSYLDYKELCYTDVACKQLQTAGIETWKQWESKLTSSGKCPASSSSNPKQGFRTFLRASSRAKRVQDLLSHNHRGTIATVFGCRKCEALRAIQHKSLPILETDNWRDYDFFCRLEELGQDEFSGYETTRCLYEGFVPYESTVVTDSGRTTMLWKTEHVLSNLATEEWGQMTRTLDFHHAQFVFGNFVHLSELGEALLSNLRVTLLAMPKSTSSTAQNNNNIHDDDVRLVASGRYYDGNRTCSDTKYSRFHFKDEPSEFSSQEVGYQSLYLTFHAKNGEWRDTEWLGIGLS